LAALVLAGCNGGGEQNPSGDGTVTSKSSTTGGNTSAGGKKFVITMIAKSTTNPVFPSAKTGAEAAAKDLGPKVGRDIEIDWQTPDHEDGQVQAQNIQQAVARHVDAILISCSDAAKVTSAINDAVAQGIPVMTFDSDAPDSKRFAFYGVDDIETGKLTMDELAKQTGEKGNVAILAGNQNAPNLQKRVQGAKDAAAKYPGMKIVGVYNHAETPEDASQKVVEAMNANPEINCWAMIGGWPLFAKSLLSELPSRHTKVVAVDALPAELAYVDSGIAPVLLAQPTYKWGEESVKIIVKHVIQGEQVEPINKMQLVRVTKENLGAWAKQLQDWGFPGIDEKFLKMAPATPPAGAGK
jgi:ribose transport system substrate-binding protein